MTKEEYALEWLQYAKNDLRAGRFLLGMKPVPAEIICFHRQQAAEKALKAFLAYNGTSVPKTHDLSNLIELCVGHCKDIESLAEPSISLNDYAVEIRYPDASQIEHTDAQKALKDADKILTFVQRRIEHEHTEL